MNLWNRGIICAIGFVTLTAAISAAEMPGVTDKEIKIGNTMPYSGPASAYGTIGKAINAYFNKVNAEGGINGRSIRFISLDDGYSPPKTKEQIRKLVEKEKVLLVFQSLGTPTNAAVHSYLNKKRVPQLFVATGASKWSDPENFPWTMGWQPNYQTEGQIYGSYILKNHPDGKIGILYQNDDYGKDYMIGLKKGLGDRSNSMIVAEESYETTSPTIDSQIIKLKASGANIFFNVTTPKFAAQAIKKIFDFNWKPVHFLNNVSASVGAVLKPAGLEKSQGIISVSYYMDPTDPHYQNTEGMKRWQKFMADYFPEGNRKESLNMYGYLVAQTMVHVLKKCGDNLTRENVMKHAANIRNLKLDTLYEGIEVNTSPSDFRPVESMQPTVFKGESFVPLGEIVKSGNDKIQ
ncbi:MAG: ABC transporter substrate-binding protein [SAR324 cluster bacterium]|nr:ABC transporter substrate-binding protein [SAR324 cluster bacterium]